MIVTLRTATLDDALYVRDHLRQADLDEVKAMGLSVTDAVGVSYYSSDACYAGCVDGVPALIFGTASPLLHDGAATVWALGTDDCDRVPLAMVKLGRRMVKELLEVYPELENYCDARYTKSLRWLQKLGFTVEKPAPYGAKSQEFCKIHIKRGEA